MTKTIRDRVFPAALLLAFLTSTAWTISAFATRIPDEIVVASRSQMQLARHSIK